MARALAAGFVLAIILGPELGVTAAGESSAAAGKEFCRGLDHEPWSADGRWLAVPREGRLAVVDMRTYRTRTVLRSPSINFSWSPQGARLVAEADGVLYGGWLPGRLVKIGTGCLGAWSPRGTRIAYTVRGWAYTADADGARRRRLAAAREVTDWSRDGSRLAIVRAKRVQCHAESRSIALIYTYRFRDGVVRQLTSDERTIDGVSFGRGMQSRATFSPDGTRVAYTERNPCGTITSHRADPYALVAPGDVSVGRGYARWAPSSRYLIVAGRSSASVVTAGGRRVATLSWHGSDWAPDGSRIAFSRQDASGGDGSWEDVHLYAVPVSNFNRMQRLATGFDPQWSPDGTRIAFSRMLHPSRRAPHCASGVFVVPAGGGAARLVLGC